ncbi:MAG: YggT family protein [Candidatus Gastranaerophilales bacterium]|nr:YggT family protein [Candidatus Gastranaerophilales bacterium]
MSLHQAIDQLFQLIELILIVRILLTWFPNVDWWKQPFKFLHDASEPILEPFRRLIPPMGGFDLSPIFAFLFLGFVQNIVLSFV